MTINR